MHSHMKGIVTRVNHVPFMKTPHMTITAISDTHGHLPLMQPSHIAIVCGDIFPGEMDHKPTLQGDWFKNNFLPWTETIDCERVFLVAGNHDCWLERNNEKMRRQFALDSGGKLVYLYDTVVDYHGFKIYGTPWVPTPFRNRAFSAEEEALKEKYASIPCSLDLLITHTVPYDCNGIGISEIDSHLSGSKELLNAIASRNIRCLIGGHIHMPKERFAHKDFSGNKTLLINSACCDNHKRPLHQPITLAIPQSSNIPIIR